ncbi:ral guanine nucleotide dissociation stimulator-like 2 isoform X1 [Sinocyclocheilus anshuiensis]|uniref:ral guanine nucleotide dissociation stimulator-like 2 isoform X1 n=2 Tax=Sinocyclocheilus anshuiensis TaxID=1608454 RepID=UPI0007B9C2EF|nr:PREDICTED: ral guanine nucleotide dissociation stimulator-like 2 isoform X1 [Sinocyclocheilus anshuiensis]XP_016312106.1 PREDICTED: ral guanine nucleotide dissociation stimulator-like 2 isoform X1 [Sinocyclocheilus anshuiensis]
MLPRSMKTSGVELPGVGQREVPLIGYRPLQPEVNSPADQLWKENENKEADHTQGEPSLMKTTWYCPLDLSTVSETEEDGIIYNVVVKQGHGSPAGPQSTVSRSQHVKAGTEEKLVLHLLHSFSMGDSSFISIFLSTYRSFTSTQRVLDILTDRLGNPPGESKSNTRQMFNKAVCTVFSTWLNNYPEDFRSLNDPACLLRLAALLPTDTSGAEIKGRLLRIAEELSEKALLSGSLSDPTRGVTSPPDPSEFDATSILGFPSSVIAEQLTRIETDLFLKLVPYHCLGSLWSQRDKKGREGACWSVRATIKQFNRLTNAVTASCLWNTALKSQQRARLLEKWISVAEACRSRKNFSSLYAILSALQSNPIHRLRKTWQETDREAVKRYEELSDIFSEKDNYSQSRELLKEEGTSKFSNLDTKINNRRFTGSCAQGTVPYLGIFLRDLTMLDTAVKDRLENGFINFDKRRREFEVIAQIRLLQSSCKNSIFRTDETFVQWYHSAPTLREEESYKLSNQIEAPGEPSPGRGLNPTVIITQCPDALSTVANTTMDADGIFDFPSPVNHLLSKLYKHVKSPSVSCLDVDSSPPPNYATPSILTTPTTAVKSHRRSVSCGNNPTNNKREAGPDMRIARIRMDLHDGNLYRSILVTSNDKTPTVISSALDKHNQNAQEASKYELIQLLPEGKELIIPPTGNVFYAMSSASVDFLLRRRGGNTPTGSPNLGNETSATFPRIKAKGRRLVRTLF